MARSAGPTGSFLGKELAKKIALVKDFAARISRALGRRVSELPSATRGTIYDPFFSGQGGGSGQGIAILIENPN
jgi:hypothetical protein